MIKKQIEIFDSTTISLFKDILACVGRKPQNGKEKGGIKMHTVINVDEVVPKMVWFTSAATHDHVLLDKLKMDENTIYVFDKGYNDYKAFEKFCLNKTSFITKIKDNTISRKSGKRLAKRTIQIRIDGFILRGLTFEIQENRKFKRLNICSLKIRKNYFVFLSDNSENIYIY